MPCFEKSKPSSWPRLAQRRNPPTPPDMSISEALQWTRGRLVEAGTPEPPLEAELLVREAVQMDAAEMYANLRTSLSGQATRLLSGFVDRRRRREPLPYILGRYEFYGRVFDVDSRVLVPRPETELLVDRALAHLRTRSAPSHRTGPQAAPIRVADVGTGSGILAVTLAAEMESVIVDAVDLSPGALAVAARNAERIGVAERVAFHRGNLLDPLDGRYDVLVSNPPYLATAALEQAQPELAHEPRVALDGGEDGTAAVSRLLEAAPRHVKADAYLLLVEIDPPIMDGARATALTCFPDAEVRVIEDGARLARCLEIVG